MLATADNYTTTEVYSGEQEGYAILPGKMQRGNVESLLRELGTTLGLRAGRLMTLLAMMDRTRPTDWVSEETEPVCYMQQTQLAQRLGKTERSVRRDEDAFIKLGLVEKRVAANGGRSRAGSLGLVFTPLIELVPRLQAMLALQKSEANEKEGHVRRRSHLKGRVYAIVKDLQRITPGCTEAQSAIEEVASWPEPESLRRNSLEAVICHHEAAQVLVDKLLILLTSRSKMSGQPDTEVRYFIQDTTQEESQYCNATPDKRTGLQPNTDLYADTPDGVSNCLENKYEAVREAHKGKFSEKLTPKRLYDLCAFDMRMHLDHAMRGRDSLLHHDFINAAYDCAAAMGVNHSAWVDAIEAMGEFSAALCVILIDANRDHPVTPIRSPGGTLRAMTRKHISGQLNIFGGLIGLDERKRQGEQT